MKTKWITLFALLQSEVQLTVAQTLGLTDPRVCYILDGILFLYAVIVTALFIKEKLTPKEPLDPQKSNEDPYNHIIPSQLTSYDYPMRKGDPEKGGRMQKRKESDNSHYAGLQLDKLNEPYSGIRKKPEQQRKRGKGNEAVYQGLSSSATRDTYDMIHMQPLPPPPHI